MEYKCHGERRPGQACKAKLTLAEAWVPVLAAVRQALGRMPSQVADLTDHTFCGRCSALGRKAGLRFYRLPATVVVMERRRVERQQAVRQAFGRYLPKERPSPKSAAGATPAAPAEVS